MQENEKLKVRAIYIVIAPDDREHRITTYLNLGWLVQATEHDVFSWLQTTQQTKTTYLLKNEVLALRLVFSELGAETLNEVKNLLRLHFLQGDTN